MKAYQIEINGHVYTIVTDKEVTHTYVVSYTDVDGVDTVRVSNGHPSQKHAYNAMRDSLKRLDDKGIGAAGRVVEMKLA